MKKPRRIPRYTELPRSTSPIARSTSPLPRGGIRRSNPARKAREFARCYGSRARVAWVKSLPCCVASGQHTGPIHNAHVGHEGAGMGRKANADQIAPMCHHHHDMLHQMGEPRFENIYALDLSAIAAATEQAWLDHLTAHQGTAA